jgi:O-antigen/teichoic acid export membrane protein
MNQPRQIFKNTVAQTISSLANRGSNILIAFVMARTLHATGIGIYATALGYFGLLDVATNMGATTFLIREIAKEPSKTNRYVVHFSVVGCVFTMIGLVLFWAILPYLGYSGELATSLYIIALAAIPGTLNAVQYSVFVAHQRVEFVTYTTLVMVTLTIAVNLYLLLFGYGVVSLIIAFVVVEYLVTIVYFYLINRYIATLHWEFEFPFALRLLREIKTFAAMSILGGVLAQPEIILLSLVASETQVGYYSAALKVAGLWQFLPQVYMTNVYPVLSRSFYSGDRKFEIIQDKSVKYLLAASLPLAVGITIAAEPIVKLLYGPGFEASVLPLQIMAWSIPVTFMTEVFWRALVARDQQRSTLWAQIMTAFTRLGGGYALSALFAALGASLSTLANLLINNLLLAYFIGRGGGRVRFWGLGWRFLLASVAMGMLISPFSHQLQLWLLVPLAGVAYVTFIFLLRAFSPDDIDLFRQIWRPKTTQILDGGNVKGSLQ